MTTPQAATDTFTGGPPPTSSLRTIEPQVCMHLLSGNGVGRVGFRNNEGQQLVPVNYVFKDGCVYFRTSPESFLAELAYGCDDVAFEVDHVELLTQTGWSVLVKGQTDAAPEPFDPTPTPMMPWAGGSRPIIVRLTPQSITGRRVRKPGLETRGPLPFAPEAE